MKKRLAIRADANEKIGIGHVMRCLAIGQSWVDEGGEVIFISKQLPQALELILTLEKDFLLLEINEADTTKDADKTASLVLENNALALIVDGYNFDSDYQKEIKKRDICLIFIDDFQHCKHYYADIVWNRSIISNQYDYADKEVYTKLFLGPQYTVLRREFSKYEHVSKDIVPIAKNILITFGGADPQNTTALALKAINMIKSKKLNVKVIIGAANPYAEIIEQESSRSHHNIHVLKHITNMAEEIMWSDVAITAGGTTMYELAFLGIPNLSIRIVNNQKALPLFDFKYGASVYLGDLNEVNEQMIQENLCLLIQDFRKRKEMHKNLKSLLPKNSISFLKL